MPIGRLARLRRDRNRPRRRPRIKATEALGIRNFHGGSHSHKALRTRRRPRPRIRPRGVMEYWSAGVLRQVRIAPAYRVGATKGALGNGSAYFENEDEDEDDYDFAFSSADGGGRTHTTLRSPDFESGASASSATSAYFQGRMVDRFCKKRKGFVVHFHDHASISPTALVTLGVDSRRKKIRTAR